MNELIKKSVQHVGLVQSGHHHHSIECTLTCSLHDIAGKLLIWH
jgi:hypothetical protein